jgi:hypothetical protein
MDRNSGFKLHKHTENRRTPLWKWIVIILLVVAMPMFFSYYKMANLNHAIKSMPTTKPSVTAPR